MTVVGSSFEQIILKTQGNNIVFHLCRTIYGGQYICYITIENQAPLSELVIKSVQEFVELSDLLRICEYFENHIEKLKTEPNNKSIVFVDDSLLYEIQALSGGWLDAGYASFSLRFLVNVGRAESKKRVWIGSQNSLTSDDILNFCKQIRELV